MISLFNLKKENLCSCSTRDTFRNFSGWSFICCLFLTARSGGHLGGMTSWLVLMSRISFFGASILQERLLRYGKRGTFTLLERSYVWYMISRYVNCALKRTLLYHHLFSFLTFPFWWWIIEYLKYLFVCIVAFMTLDTLVAFDWLALWCFSLINFTFLSSLAEMVIFCFVIFILGEWSGSLWSSALKL